MREGQSSQDRKPLNQNTKFISSLKASTLYNLLLTCENPHLQTEICLAASVVPIKQVQFTKSKKLKFLDLDCEGISSTCCFT